MFHPRLRSFTVHIYRWYSAKDREDSFINTWYSFCACFFNCFSFSHSLFYTFQSSWTLQTCFSLHSTRPLAFTCDKSYLVPEKICFLYFVQLFNNDSKRINSDPDIYIWSLSECPQILFWLIHFEDFKESF